MVETWNQRADTSVLMERYFRTAWQSKGIPNEFQVRGSHAVGSDGKCRQWPHTHPSARADRGFAPSQWPIIALPDCRPAHCCPVHRCPIQSVGSVRPKRVRAEGNSFTRSHPFRPSWPRCIHGRGPLGLLIASPRGCAGRQDDRDSRKGGDRSRWLQGCSCAQSRNRWCVDCASLARRNRSAAERQPSGWRIRQLTDSRRRHGRSRRLRKDATAVGQSGPSQGR